MSSTLPTVDSSSRVFSGSNTSTELSPAAEFRNKYYLSQQQEEDDVDDDFIYRPGAIIYAPLNINTPGIKLTEQVYDDEDDTEEEEYTLFESKSTLEPKITLEDGDKENKLNNSTLLSKLSKSTAPMRAKLSKTNLDHLWVNSSTTLTLPLRKSAESVHHMSLSRKKRKEKNERSHSFSFDSPTSTSPSLSLTNDFLIYPALLSKVAEAFKESMVVGTKSRDSIQYHDVFDGRDAVNKLACIIKTSDRNLAVLVGRALGYQKFFHNVNYMVKLRDATNELYQFAATNPNNRPKRKLSADSDTIIPDYRDEFITREDNQDLPNGVFTLLTDCYSSTCTRDSSCYSVLCPRRFNQKSQNSLSDENDDRLWIKTASQAILNTLSSKEIRRQENIYELIYTEKDFVEDLVYVEKNWMEPLLSHESIPKDRSKQFVEDLFWNLSEIRESNALLLNDLLDRQKLHIVVNKIGDVLLKHVMTVFEPFVDYGSHQVISKYVFETEKLTNLAFSKLVETIERSPESRKLELNGYLTKPTTRLGRYNLLLREILKHTPDDHPDCKTIPKVMHLINGFLERVNEKSGKTENAFSLKMLEEKLSWKKGPIVNQEIEDLDLLSPDRKIIMKGPLKRKCSGNTSEASELQIYVLDHCLLIIKSKFFDNAEIYKLYKKAIPLALLVISLPDQAKRSSSILPYNRSSTGSFYSSGSVDFMPPVLSTSTGINSKNGYPISFIHLGRQGSGTTTLYASTLASRRKWVDTIERYRYSIMEKSKVFRMIEISEHYFNSFNKVNCAAAYGESMMIGCDHGVYLKKSMTEEDGEDDEGIVRILSMDKVSQIDILDGPKLMLILADKILYTYSIEALFDEHFNYLACNLVSTSTSSPTTTKMKTIRESSIKSSTSSSAESHDSKNRFTKALIHKKTHVRKLSSNVSFFKVGKVFDKTGPNDPIERTLVCFVKYNAMTSTIRALEPYDDSQDAKKKKRKSNHLGLFMRNSTDVLRGFKDLYIPGEATSIQYFKNVICVGSAKGFQMVDIGSAGVQSVLDPSDENHNFISQRETLKPVSMFRHPDGYILLCYNEIAFYIDKKGRRVRSEWVIHWEGHPTAFAFQYPYILAFDSSFIEIRHINSGDLTQVIPGNNIRCLRPDPSDTIYCVMEDRRSGNELVFSLKFSN
ncbi:hypothetical protein INT47_002458 [Mucor saturninus]|uniref:Uncharacterized protein n=1 Tax=Mucor saturninus TaxID=64648 RepID=A0A8H7V553_9FUNG|nr:hypothetical protein INT47_002458 [Mucor saturninus]